MRLDRSDKNLIAIALLLIAASAAFVSLNYKAAFPQASLDLTLSQNDITEKARAFLRTRGFSTQGFRNLTLFDPDDEARLYLERELGLEQANKLMSGEAPIWQWRARWSRPPEKEELIVWLRPNAKLVAFEHRILETAAGAKLSRDEARLQADAFLQSQTTVPHKLVSEQSEVRPNRVDHVFTWEQDGFRAKDATIRRTVEVHGDKVGRYREFLYVPEQWQRDFAKLRSANELYASIAQALYVVLALASLVLLVLGLRRRSVPWRPLLRISAVVAGVNLLNEWNTIMLTIDRMSTSSPVHEMVLLALLQGFGSAAGILLYVLIPAAAAMAWYVRAYPHQLPLTLAFTLPGMATRSFFRASVAGFAMAAGHMIFLTAFYLIGAKIGVWSPQDVEYTDVLSTPLPWVYPLAIAMMASSAEEFWFRLLAIPLLGRFLRNRWLVIIIPAFVWGFLHANYPQQPGYIRGVEVGLIGVAAGWMMLRFGIVATLVWHYTIDAFLIGLFLFRAESWLYRAHGLVVALCILAPLLIAGFLYRRNGGFREEIYAPVVPDEPTDVEDRPVLVDPPAPVLSLKWLYAGAALLGVVAILAKPVLFGDFIRVAVTRDQAEGAAIAEMQTRGLDPAGWRMVADFTPNLRGIDAEYLRQQVGAAKANEILRDRLTYAIWQVRFFKPLSPEQWFFYINPSGQVYRFDHSLDEKAAGAKLTQPEARQAAEEFLRTRTRFENLQLVDAQQEVRDNRTDHSFVWEDKTFRVGEARLRVSLNLIGNETCEYRTFLKLPEAWVREHTKTRLTEHAQPAFLGAFGVWMVVLLIRLLSQPGIRLSWKTYASIAVAVGLAALIAQWNEEPAWLQGYDTSTPFETFVTQVLIGRASLLLFTLAGVFAALLAFDVLRQSLLPGTALAKPSLARAAGVAALLAGVGRAMEWIRQLAGGPREDLPLWKLSAIDTAIPAIGAAYGALIMGVLAACIAGACVSGALRMLTRSGLLKLAAFGVVSFALADTWHWTELPLHLGIAVLYLACLVLIALTVGSDVIAVGLALFWLAAGSEAWRLIHQPALPLHFNGFALIAIAGLITAGVLWRAQRDRAAVAAVSPNPPPEPLVPSAD